MPPPQHRLNKGLVTRRTFETRLSFLRVRQLWQSRLCASCHPGHEWFPDWDEEAEGSAQAFQEWQQTLLILAPGPSPLPSSNASIARVSLPLSQGHHCRDSLGQRERSPQAGDSKSLKKNKKNPDKNPKSCNDLSTFYCIAFLHFYHVIWFRLNILLYMIIYGYYWVSVCWRYFLSLYLVESIRCVFMPFHCLQVKLRQVD